MMRYIVLILLLLPVVLHAQLVQPQWKHTVLSSGGIIQPAASAQDGTGNIYLLAYVDTGAILNGKRVTGKEGPMYLIKMDPAGSVLWVKPMDVNTPGVAFSMAADGHGNVLIGGGFRHNITYDGQVLAYTGGIGHNVAEINAFVLKLDGGGNVVWLTDYACTYYAYATHLVVDERNNVYTAIHRIGDLYVQDRVYSEKDSFQQSTIVKLSETGSTTWSYAERGPGNEGVMQLQMFKPKEGCPQQLLVLKSHYTGMWEWHYTYELEMMTIDGAVVRTDSLFSSYMNTIGAMEVVGDKIYLAGTFYDSLDINNQRLDLRDANSFVARLDELLQMEEVKPIAKTQGYNRSATVLKYVPGKGLLLGGMFKDSFTVNGNVYYANPYSYIPGLNGMGFGSYMALLNKDLTATDVRFADGRWVNLHDIYTRNNDVVVCAEHRSADNALTGKAVEAGITLFRPQAFEGGWQEATVNKDLQYKVYPTPFRDVCHVGFESPVYGYEYVIYNSAGQLVKDAYVKASNDTTIYIDMTGQASGLYFLRMKSCCAEEITVKLLKAR